MLTWVNPGRLLKLHSDRCPSGPSQSPRHSLSAVKKQAVTRAKQHTCYCRRGYITFYKYSSYEAVSRFSLLCVWPSLLWHRGHRGLGAKRLVALSGPLSSQLQVQLVPGTTNVETCIPLVCMDVLQLNVKLKAMPFFDPSNIIECSLRHLICFTHRVTILNLRGLPSFSKFG